MKSMKYRIFSPFCLALPSLFCAATGTRSVKQYSLSEKNAAMYKKSQARLPWHDFCAHPGIGHKKKPKAKNWLRNADPGKFFGFGKNFKGCLLCASADLMHPSGTIVNTFILIFKNYYAAVLPAVSDLHSMHRHPAA